jgi:hypothetical protein
MFRPLGHLQVDSKIIGGKYHIQPSDNFRINLKMA